VRYLDREKIIRVNADYFFESCSNEILLGIILGEVIEVIEDG
jgi:hypothetical protein